MKWFEGRTTEELLRTIFEERGAAARRIVGTLRLGEVRGLCAGEAPSKGASA